MSKYSRSSKSSVINLSLAEKLRRFRLMAGFSQKNVAEALNINRSTYTYYEVGKTIPDPATLNRIATLFDVPVAEFFAAEPAEQVLMLRDSGPKRVSRKTKFDPQKVGDLTSEEKTIIAFIRDNNISAADVMHLLSTKYDPLSSSETP